MTLPAKAAHTMAGMAIHHGTVMNPLASSTPVMKSSESPGSTAPKMTPHSMTRIAKVIAKASGPNPRSRPSGSSSPVWAMRAKCTSSPYGCTTLAD